MTMRRLISTALAVFSGCCVMGMTSSVLAQQATAEGWTSVEKIPNDVAAGEAYYRPEAYSPYRLDRTALGAVLKGVPMERTAAAANPLRMRFPMPNGGDCAGFSSV